MERLNSFSLTPLLLLICIQAATFLSQTTAVAGESVGSSSATGIGKLTSIREENGTKPCPIRMFCLPAECPTEEQICEPILPGCPCCPRCPDPAPPSPGTPRGRGTPVPPPAPPVCPNWFWCPGDEGCKAGEVPFCLEPRPEGCPCCLACKAPDTDSSTPPSHKNPDPPIAPPPIQPLARPCVNDCFDHCGKFPGGCKNVVCPMIWCPPLE
eukprot:jgi/Botrbrau1/7840/Bobra.9_2s0019.1